MIPASERPYIAIGLAALITLVGIAGLYAERRVALLAPPTGVVGNHAKVSSIVHLVGTISSINGNTILFEPRPWYQVQTTRSVTTNASTLIQQRTQKSSAVFQSEVKATAGKASSTPPLPFVVKTISLADLHPGENVIVSSNQDISSAVQISATQIIAVLPAPTH